MRFAVVNGSPKGNGSITLQTVKYLELCFPEHDFDVLDAGQGIAGFRRDFSRAKAFLENFDALIFSYPVYTFLAPSQLHEFISLMKTCGIDFNGRYVTQITTSKHFYDVTAHRYVEDNCADMGMRIVRGLSADMDDLTKESGRRQAKEFFEYFLFCMDRGLCEKRSAFKPDFSPVIASAAEETSGEKSGDTVSVTDAGPDDVSLLAMIERFRAVYGGKTRVMNIRDAGIRGGCLGCMHCAATGICVYTDGFDDYLRNQIQSAEATVYAFVIKDHSMGVLFKTFDDRQFCNGHRTVTAGKPVGYLISGALSQEENLRTVLTARADAGGNFLAGLASDEKNPDAEIDETAMRLDYALTHNYAPPQTFWGVGGMRIFRDLIYLMRGMMRADHKYYKKHGLYDFPQKKPFTSAAMYLVGAVFNNEKLLSKSSKYIGEGMLAPYRKALEKAEKNEK